MCTSYNFDKKTVIFRRIGIVYNGGTDRFLRFAGREKWRQNMKRNQEDAIPQSMLLTQDIVRFGGMQIRYSLHVREDVPTNRFEIRVAKDDESMRAAAGDRLDDAIRYYHSVVEGIVTPCTLEDVMKDFEYSRRKLQKNLYKRSIM